MSRVPNSRSVEYSVNVRVGRSVTDVRRLAQALNTLQNQVTAVQSIFGATNPLQQVYTQGLGALSTALTQLNTLLPRLNNHLAQQQQHVQAAANAVNNLAAAQQNVTRTTSSWARGMAVLRAQQDPWLRGLQALQEQRNAAGARRAAGQQAWATGMQNIMAQNAAQANNPWLRGLNNLQQQRQAAAAAAQLQQNQQAAAGIQNVANQLNAQQAAAQNAAGAMLNLQMVAGQLLTVLGTGQILAAVRDFTLLAGRVENLNTVMLAVGATNNLAAGQMRILQDGLKNLGITTQVSREILTRFAQNNLKLADSLKIARIAQDAAVVAGLNSSETAERMMIAVQRLDTRMLRNIGILVNLRNEYQKIAVETGRYENSLTAGEKQQIVLNAVIRAGAALAGTYEKSLQDVFKQWTTLDRKIEESQRVIGEHFLPVFQLLVDVVDTVTESIGYGNTVWGTLAAILVGGAAGLGIAASVLAIAAAFGALIAVLSPVAIVLIALGALFGSVAAAMSSLTQASRIHERTMREEADRMAYVALRSQELAGQIERLSAIQNRTSSEEIELINAKQEAMALFTRAQDKNTASAMKAANAAKNTQSFVDILRKQGSGYESAASPAQQIADKQAELLAAQKQLKETVDYFDLNERHGLGVKDLFTIYATSTHKMLENVKLLKLEVKALEEASDRIELDGLNDISDRMENLHRLALNARKAVDDLAISKLSDPASDIVKRIDKLNELAAATQTTAQIQRQYALAVREQDRNLEKDNETTRTEAEKAGKSQAEIDGAISDRTLKHAAAVHNLKIRMDEQIKQLEELKKNREALGNETEKQITRMEMAHQKESDIARLSLIGLQDLAENLSILTERSMDYDEALAAINSQIAQQKAAIQGVTEGILSGKFVGEELINMGLRLESLKQGLKGLEAAANDVLPSFKEQMSKAVRSIVDSLGTGKMAMEEMRLATISLRTENTLLAKGIASDLVQGLSKGTEEANKFEVEFNKLATAASEIQDQIDKVDAQIFRSEDDPEKTKALKAEMESLLELHRGIREKYALLKDKQVEMEKKAQREILEIQKNAIKKQMEIAEEAAKKSVDIRKELQKDEASTALDMLKEDLSFRKNHGDPLAGSAEKILSMFEKYKRLLSNAGPTQTQDILEMFKRDVLAQTGNRPDLLPPQLLQFLNSIATELQNEAQNRINEVNRQLQEANTQQMIATRAQQTVDQLTAIRNILEGKDPDAAKAAAIAALKPAGPQALRFDELTPAELRLAQKFAKAQFGAKKAKEMFADMPAQRDPAADALNARASEAMRDFHKANSDANKATEETLKDVANLSGLSAKEAKDLQRKMRGIGTDVRRKLTSLKLK